MTQPDEATMLEQQIAQWRMYLRGRRAVAEDDAEELEGHLRDQIAALTDAGLAEEEAFLIAVKRMGSLNDVSREFARAHSDRLWKQLVIAPSDGEASGTANHEIAVVLSLAVAAAIAIKLPALFGLPMVDENEAFYARNISLFVLPFLSLYFAWKRQMTRPRIGGLMAAFLGAGIAANFFTFAAPSDTLVLSIVHMPMALWLLVGVAYAGGDWFHGDRRMDFVRFSGELFIYFVLIALGGGLFTAFTLMLFRSISLDAEWFAQRWLLPCGAMGAVLVASWLVEAKQSVIENMAPVLTRLFTPLLAIVLLGFLAAMAWTGNPVAVDRDILIAFDLLLALVVGLILYAASARDPSSPPGFFDWLQLLLVVAALAVDVLALAAIAARIHEFGFTPNRVAALAENVILLVNLAWTARLYINFVRQRGSFEAIERWQMAYLPVYSAWAAIVVCTFPPLVDFR